MAENQPIIVKRIKKGGHAHHGGAWKVAYADFVTAMMAFFLMLWLLNSVTEEQLEGIADYFAPTMVSASTSGSDGALGGQVISEGAMQSRTSPPSISMQLPPASISTDGEDLTEPQEAMTEDQFEQAMAEREQQQFEKAQEALKQAINSIPELAKLKESLLVDNTPEGLRIQLIDQEGLAMFPRGSANMYGHTRAILDLVSRVVTQLPQRIQISGHTDAVKFSQQSNYTNWELSADRALASRRVLMMSGVPEARIDRVVGKADTDPLVKEDPANARNRRISIILLRENDLKLDGSQSINGRSVAPAGVLPPESTPNR